jgi:hypothetical protein
MMLTISMSIFGIPGLSGMIMGVSSPFTLATGVEGFEIMDDSGTLNVNGSSASPSLPESSRWGSSVSASSGYRPRSEGALTEK